MEFIYQSFFNMIFDGAAKVINDASSISLEIFEQDAVKNILAFFKLLGAIILAVGILFAIGNYCISKAEGDSIRLDDLVLNILKSIIAIEFMQDSSIYIFNLANTVASSIKDTIQIQADYGKIIDALVNVLTGYTILWGILFGVIFLFLWIFILIQATKRGGMFFMQILVGYFYLFGLPLGNTEGILDWCRQTAALAITNIIQVSALIIALNLMIDNQLFPALVLLFAATSAEKIAGRFGMSAGARQTIGGGIRSVGSTVNTITSLRRAAA